MRPIIQFCPLFLLAKHAEREKAWQKEKRRGEVCALQSATKGGAFGIRKLLKKLDQNFYK